MNRNILIVEDDRNLAAVLSRVLQREGYECVFAITVSEGKSLLEERLPGIVLTDMYLPDGTGLEILERAKSINSDIDVIVMTANATVDSAIMAMKKGAHDYLLKPFQVEELVLHVKKMLERKALISENIYLKEGLKSRYKYADLIGRSPQMQELFDTIARVSNGKSGVLIQGESGTGKELVARAIHFGGDRSDKMFVPINCSAIPENLLESELFGHLKGSYTGAAENKKGLFEYADQGTLFLDEIGDLSKMLQAKLLRVLQDGRMRRVGDHKEIEVDVRVLAATNKDLAALIRNGDFREDLFFRLSVIPIHIAPLRERREDIKLLAEHFMGIFTVSKESEIRFTKEAMELLAGYPWPGNVRELRNLIERIAILKRGKTIAPDDLPKEVAGNHSFPPVVSGLNYNEAKMKVLDDFHQRIIGKALQENEGNVSRAAETLGMDRGNFQRLMRRYGIQSSAFRDGE
jgi:two-component system response regulator AtoC